MIIRLFVLASMGSIMMTSQAVYHDWVLDECYHVSDGSVISSRVRCSICGAGNQAFSGVSGGYCLCHDPRRSVAVRSRSLGSTDSDMVDANNLANDINAELDQMPPSVREALDWSSGIPSYGSVGNGYGVQWNYKPVGSVVTTSGGSQGVVSGSPTGIGAYVVEVPNTGDGVVSGYSSDGTVGTWTITPGIDGTYGSSFTPNWNGGVGGRSGTSSLDSPSSGFSGGTSGGSSGGNSGGWLGLAFIGGGSSGGSSGGSYSWTGGYSYNNSNSQYNNNTSTENYNIDYENSTHLNYYFNQPQTETRVIEIPVSSGGGGSSSGGGGSSSGGGGSSGGSSQSVEVRVISVPSETVTLQNGQNITLHDYSSILNAIGGYLSSGFQQTHSDLNVINENLRRTLEVDDIVDLEEPKNEDQLSPLFDDKEDQEEVKTLTDKMKEDTSGWRFDFGMGNNPIGNFIKGLIGNPPVAFGSRDEVCQVTIPIYGELTVDYSFRLTDWFGSAFRSCILFILSIIFVIATAKTISGAFA